ncbi:hypothetical protein P7L78_19210 [Tistrella bauzanensis]|uniref:hypothetical protein n=1 Tax=Tistrella TaxID=171436 RepID=UPI0031F6E63B
MAIFTDIRSRAASAMQSALHCFAANLPAESITRADGRPYLIRALVCRLPGGRRIYLHAFVGSDEPALYHDHPCRFVCIILAGHYQEDTLRDDVIGVPIIRTRTLNAGRVNFIAPDRRHRIEILSPVVWTLVYRGRTRSMWSLRRIWRGPLGRWHQHDRLMRPGPDTAWRNAPRFEDVWAQARATLDPEGAARHVH